MNWLRSLLRPAKAAIAPRATISAYGIGPGDDIVIGCDAGTDEDAFALLGAVQSEFPASRVHLLIGFGPVQVSRNNCCAQCESPCQEAKQEISIEQDASYARSRLPEPGEKRNVVLLRHCSGGRVIAISVPPQQQGGLSLKPVFTAFPLKARTPLPSLRSWGCEMASNANRTTQAFIDRLYEVEAQTGRRLCQSLCHLRARPELAAFC